MSDWQLFGHQSLLATRSTRAASQTKSAPGRSLEVRHLQQFRAPPRVSGLLCSFAVRVGHGVFDETRHFHKARLCRHSIWLSRADGCFRPQA